MNRGDILELSNAFSGAAYFGSMIGIHKLGASWWVAVPVAFVLGVVVYLAAERLLEDIQKRSDRRKSRRAFHNAMRNFDE